MVQIAWERGKKFNKRLKQGLPDLYNMFEEFLQFIYLPGIPDPHFITVKVILLNTRIKCLIQNSNVDTYQFEKTNYTES